MTPLAPIEDAVAASYDQADVRRDLENRLIATLQGDISRDAKDYVCRKLTIVGTVAAVPALASLLGEKDYSHMARMALERMPAPEAAQVLRDAATKVSSELKVGVIGSLGSRRDAAAVSVLNVLLKDGDPSVARSAALARRHWQCRCGLSAESSGDVGDRKQSGRDRCSVGLCRSAAGRPKAERRAGDL